MGDAIEAMRTAFSRDREVPLRTLVGSSLFMPGRVGSTTGIKVVSVVPGQPSGIVAVFDEIGEPVGIVDGPTLTAIRTGAVCGLATDLLAPADASTMALLGAGAMAPDQVEAVRAVRPIDRVTVWSRSPRRARDLADIVGGQVATTVPDGIEGAAIVSCATPATSPLFEDQDLERTVHVNAVGAFTPEMAELPQALLDRAFVVVDDIEAAAEEAGDLIQAGRSPDVDLATLLEHGHRPHDVTVFKSVGIASQDIAAARVALANAERDGLGTVV